MVREYKKDAQTTESVNEYLKFDFLPYKSSIDSLYGVTQKLQTMRNQHPTKANTFSYVFPRETQKEGN
jgi:hypothetical protein